MIFLAEHLDDIRIYILNNSKLWIFLRILRHDEKLRNYNVLLKLEVYFRGSH
jgi:hypothetical protein